MTPIDRAVAEAEELFALSLTEKQSAQLALYLDLLQQWSKRVNLIGRLETDELIKQHFFESFWVSRKLLPRPVSLADIGSGAGFPGAAIQLFDPLHTTWLLESSQKKCSFLRELSLRTALRLDIFPGRAEQFPHWAQIQLATIRAVRPSPQLLEILRRAGIHLLAFHGRALQPGLGRWACLKSLLIPGSNNRYASLFSPPGSAGGCFT